MISEYAVWKCLVIYSINVASSTVAGTSGDRTSLILQ